MQMQLGCSKMVSKGYHFRMERLVFTLDELVSQGQQGIHSDTRLLAPTGRPRAPMILLLLYAKSVQNGHL
jgi:hypothetical protein